MKTFQYIKHILIIITLLNSVTNKAEKYKVTYRFDPTTQKNNHSSNLYYRASITAINFNYPPTLVEFIDIVNHTVILDKLPNQISGLWVVSNTQTGTGPKGMIDYSKDLSNCIQYNPESTNTETNLEMINFFPFFTIDYYENSNIVCANSNDAWKLRLSDSEIYCGTSIKLRLYQGIDYENIIINVTSNILEIPLNKIPLRFRNNFETKIRVVQPDNTLSNELGHFFCIQPPKITFAPSIQPSCYNTNDASITAIFPDSDESISFLLTIKRYIELNETNATDIIVYENKSYGFADGLTFNGTEQFDNLGNISELLINQSYIDEACTRLGIPETESIQLKAGVYSFGVQIQNPDLGASLCLDTTLLKIEQPTPVTFTSATAIDVINASDPLPSSAYQAISSTSTGSATIDITGGTGNYQLVNQPTGWIYNDATKTLFGLSASPTGNTHTISMEDSNGCAATPSKQVTITCPADIVINFTQSPPTYVCGDDTTHIRFNVKGGAGSFSAVLTKNGQQLGSQTINTRNNYEFSGLSSGNYTLTVTDQATGRSSFNTTKTFNIAKYNIPDLSVTPTNISSCDNSSADGKLTIAPANGNGDSYIYEYKSATALEFTSSNNAIIPNLAEGTYTVRVNSRGCYSDIKTATISRREQPTITAESLREKTCDISGTITLNVNKLNSGEDYRLTILDSQENLNSSDFSAISTNESQTINVEDNTNFVTKDYYAKIQIVGDYSCADTTSVFTIGYTNPLDLLSIDNTSIIDEACQERSDAQLTISNSYLIEDGYTFAGGGTFDKASGIVSGLSADPGIYTFTITENTERGCKQTLTMDKTDSIKVSSNTISAVYDTTQASCNTGINGSITLSASGGFNNKTEVADNYTFYKDDDAQYSGPNSSYIFNGLIGNQTYELKVEDDYGCSITINQTPGYSNSDPITITEPAITNHQYCIDGLNGNFNISAKTNTGGSMNFELNDKSLQSYPNISNNTNISFYDLPANTYTLTVTDNISTCTDTAQVSIKNLGLSPSVETSIRDSLACSSAKNGAIDIAIIPYKDFPDASFPVFSLTGQLDGDVSATNSTSLSKEYLRLTNQNYTLTLTDEYGCTISNSITIPVLSNAVTLNTPTILPPHCYAAGNGSIAIDAINGKPFTGDEYHFQLLDTDNTVLQEKDTSFASFANLIQGNEYLLKVLDSANCADISDPIIIPEKDSVLITEIRDTINISCNGSSTGSFRPVINWLEENVEYHYIINSLNGYSEQDIYTEGTRINDLPADTFNITITGSNNCVAEYSGIILTQPDSMQIFNPWNNYIRSKGASTGEYRLQIIEGSKVYDYQWLDSVSNTIIEEGQIRYSEESSEYEAILNIVNQPAGRYTLRLRDTAQCAYFTDEEWYTQQINLIEPEDTLGFESITLKNITCNKFSDGSIELLAKGGWGDATDYRYSLDTLAQTKWYQDKTLFDQLAAGFYYLFLKDTADVVYQTQVELTQPDTLDILVEDQFNASCPNYSDGWVKAAVLKDAGYTNNLFYSIVNANAKGDTISTNTISDTAYFYNLLSRGTYQISVEDSNWCYASKTFNIGEPDTAQISLNYNYIRRKGDATGIINAVIENGNGLFDYAWYRENETETFDSGQTNAFTGLENLLAGNYLLMLRDTAGCVYEDDEWMRRSIAIIEPDLPLLTDTLDIVSPYCNGLSNGFVQLQATGGWGNYTYILNNESNQDGLFQNLAAGTYSLIIRDSVDIEYQQDLTITEPKILTASLRNYKDIRCYDYSDGYINLDIEGGNLMYEVSVDNNSWFANDSVPDLPVGTYTVYIRDTLDCQTSVADITLTQPTKLEQTVRDITFTRCSNNEGSILSAYSGGIEPYSYNWAKLSIDQKDTINLDISTPSIDDLNASYYLITVVDGHDCEFQDTFWIGDITDLSIDTILVKNVSCYGYSDGEAMAIVSNGNRDYNYSWVPQFTQVNDSTIQGMPTGSYDLVIQDAKGCLKREVYSVGTPDSLAYSINTLTDPLCLGGKKGDIDLTAIGGTMPYQYQWDNGSTSTSVNGIDPGSLNLQVTDNHNCVNNFRFYFDYQRTVQPFIGNDTLICHYNTLPINAGSYSKYQWTSDNNFSSAQQNVVLTEPDNYYLQVTDNDNCIGFDTLQVDVSYLAIASVNTVDVTCNGIADASAVIDVTPANWAHTIKWPDISNQTEWQNISGGDYAVSVLDSYGCADTVSFSIYEPDPLRITNNLVMDPYCFGVADGKIEVSTSGGRLPHTLNWLHGSQSNKIAKLDTGRYVLEVYDLMNCFETEEYILGYEKTIYPQLGEDQIICAGNNIRLYPGEFDQYQWSTNNDIIATDSSLVVTETDTYYVEVINDENCIGRDTVKVEATNSSLTPEFLMASSVPVGDTLIIIEVSQPKPSYFNWTISGPYQIVEQDDYYCKVIFEEEGNWEITLNAYVGDCLGQNIKRILVTPAIDHTDASSSNQNNRTISSLSVAPNPTNGPFNATLTLTEASDAIFYLVNIDNGQIIEKRQVNGMNSYIQSFSLAIPGMYAVFAESKGERVVRKLVVY